MLGSRSRPKLISRSGFTWTGFNRSENLNQGIVKIIFKNRSQEPACKMPCCSLQVHLVGTENKTDMLPQPDLTSIGTKMIRIRSTWYRYEHGRETFISYLPWAVFCRLTGLMRRWWDCWRPAWSAGSRSDPAWSLAGCCLTTNIHYYTSNLT